MLRSFFSLVCRGKKRKMLFIVALVCSTYASCVLNQWQQKILQKHNTWRAAVSPPASNMFRLVWDTKIAANAASWYLMFCVFFCVSFSPLRIGSCDSSFSHSSDSNRSNVGGYPILGENLAYCGGSSCTSDPSITDGSGIAMYGKWPSFSPFLGLRT